MERRDDGERWLLLGRRRSGGAGEGSRRWCWRESERIGASAGGAGRKTWLPIIKPQRSVVYSRRRNAAACASRTRTRAPARASPAAGARAGTILMPRSRRGKVLLSPQRAASSVARRDRRISAGTTAAMLLRGNRRTAGLRRAGETPGWSVRRSSHWPGQAGAAIAGPRSAARRLAGAGAGRTPGRLSPFRRGTMPAGKLLPAGETSGRPVWRSAGLRFGGPPGVGPSQRPAWGDQVGRPGRAAGDRAGRRMGERRRPAGVWPGRAGSEGW
jgi:hypothetical protein